MSKSRKPILVTGSNRSGTTWMGKTISRHRGVYYVHEPFNVGYPNKIVGLKLNTWFASDIASQFYENIV